MGSENILNTKKPHYDIFMSRRTRKPSNLKTEPDQERKNKEQDEEKDKRKPSNLKNEPDQERKNKEQQEEERDKRKLSSVNYNLKHKQKSLKELIESRCSLGQQFRIEEEKEKRDQMVVRQSQEDQQNKIARIHTKGLSHLIKVKLEYSNLKSLRKPAMLLKYIKDY